ncbi:MAG: protein-L-isoaspartate O-methyltransferase [Thermoplasmata archaeon]|nr:protein-L-isoaspartate O-methyltransferase [Thermoplasmata archaeon]
MESGDGFLERRKRLVSNLVSAGYIRTKEVEKAMMKIPRENFVPRDLLTEAYIDTPLPIGKGQTISAPHMVAIMLEELMLEQGQKVLEIGAGSGYHAALTAELVSPGGFVYTIERIPELVGFARANIEKAGYGNCVEVIEGDGSKGYPENSPYDRIFVACGAPDLPKPLISQLAEDGVMLVPVGGRYFQDLIRARKKKGKLLTENRGGCVFVPLIGEYGYE